MAGYHPPQLTDVSPDCSAPPHQQTCWGTPNNTHQDKLRTWRIQTVQSPAGFSTAQRRVHLQTQVQKRVNLQIQIRRLVHQHIHADKSTCKLRYRNESTCKIQIRRLVHLQIRATCNGHPLSALVNNRIRDAVRRHTTTPISHTAVSY